MEHLKEFLQSQSSASVLAHALGIRIIPHAPSLLSNAIINVVDCESWERDGNKLTEIGLSTFSVHDMHAVPSPGDHGINLLKNVYFYHHRLTTTALLINGRWVAGNPTKNRFGNTRFVTPAEAKAALREAFNWPLKPAKGKGEPEYCPVIFMGHAIHNDLSMLSRALDFDVSLFGTAVMTIDTQELAPSLGVYTGPGHLISLRRLCESHGFEYRDTHTAGNDAAYTLFGAVFMVLNHFGIAGEGGLDAATDEGSSPTLTPQQVVDTIEALSRDQVDNWGVATFCERCDRYNHLRRDCRARVNCQVCLQANRKGAARSHMTSRCTWK
ncbi:uncharacterized protein EI97DRAFT_370871 [Westerdykella ornata]|uniref:Gfd2/YDR514C-like C-terminal domain-containing protein n=1 Tax=Westerdykella ornata TaxID=318751 RepID=A0A6A6JT17_WESOR|nr:uncharacterized protein EI97DRAFT_370871 [Westerdykella ornata]KAF2279712.1 hypothetical protein EI97DRAFT_370871 [Westerdykella ornata]